MLFLSHIEKPAHFSADNPLVPDANGEVDLLLNKHKEAIAAHPSPQIRSCGNKLVNLSAPLGTHRAITPASLFTQLSSILHFTSIFSVGQNQFQPAIATSTPSFQLESCSGSVSHPFQSFNWHIFGSVCPRLSNGFLPPVAE